MLASAIISFIVPSKIPSYLCRYNIFDSLNNICRHDGLYLPYVEYAIKSWKFWSVAILIMALYGIANDLRAVRTCFDYFTIEHKYGGEKLLLGSLVDASDGGLKGISREASSAKSSSRETGDVKSNNREASGVNSSSQEIGDVESSSQEVGNININSSSQEVGNINDVNSSQEVGDVKSNNQEVGNTNINDNIINTRKDSSSHILNNLAKYITDTQAHAIAWGINATVGSIGIPFTFIVMVTFTVDMFRITSEEVKAKCVGRGTEIYSYFTLLLFCSSIVCFALAELASLYYLVKKNYYSEFLEKEFMVPKPLMGKWAAVMGRNCVGYLFGYFLIIFISVILTVDGLICFL